MNGTGMLVEKKHADNNWILNDGKVLETYLHFYFNYFGIKFIL